MKSFKQLLVETITYLPEPVLKAGYELRRKGGKTVDDISDRLGYSRQIVSRYLDSDENKKRPDYHPHVSSRNNVKITFSDDDLKKMYGMRKEGKSDKKIATHFGYSKKRAVYREMEANKDRFPDHYYPHNVVRRGNPNTNSDDLKAKIIHRHTNLGHSYKQIGKDLSITRSKIAGIINRLRGEGKRVISPRPQRGQIKSK